MWYVCDVLYEMYTRVNWFVMRGCAVSRKYINVQTTRLTRSVAVTMVWQTAVQIVATPTAPNNGRPILQI